MVYNIFDQKSAGGGVNIPLEFNEELAKEMKNQLKNYTKQLLENLKKKSLFWI